MLGTRDYGVPDDVPEGPWEAFREHGVFPDLEAVQFVARAITPPKRPKRFDTRFFAVDRRAIAHEVGGVIGPDAELIELAWVNLEEAKRLDLPTITTVILDELETRLKAGFAPELPVPFYYERNRKFQREVL
jgi:hypothetical protein